MYMVSFLRTMFLWIGKLDFLDGEDHPAFQTYEAFL